MKGVPSNDRKLTIELDREIDGRWIAEVPELNVLLYGDSEQDAIQRAQLAAKEILIGSHSARGAAPGLRERYVRNRGVSSWPATEPSRFTAPKNLAPQF